MLEDRSTSLRSVRGSKLDKHFGHSPDRWLRSNRLVGLGDSLVRERRTTHISSLFIQGEMWESPRRTFRPSHPTTIHQFGRSSDTGSHGDFRVPRKKYPTRESSGESTLVKWPDPRPEIERIEFTDERRVREMRVPIALHNTVGGRAGRTNAGETSVDLRRFGYSMQSYRVNPTHERTTPAKRSFDLVTQKRTSSDSRETSHWALFVLIRRYLYNQNR